MDHSHRGRTRGKIFPLDYFVSSFIGDSFLRRAHANIVNSKRREKESRKGGLTMENTRPTMEQTLEKLAARIRSVPEEKAEEVRIFLEGYLAGLERVLGKQAS